MKEFLSSLPDDAMEYVKQQQHKIQKTKIGTLLPHSGHKCFEYNKATNIISLAIFEESAISFTAAARGEVAARRKVNTKEHCLYTTALNFKNAVKHFQKQLQRKINPIFAVNQNP